MTRGSRSVPTEVMHFTHVENLPSIVLHGLYADTRANDSGMLTVDVGNQGIKAMRRRRPVRVAPYGAVADYVPFYFAARSPMMYAIERDNVRTYTGGCDDLVYLCSTVQRLARLGLQPVFTDRNAVQRYAHFTDDHKRLDTLVDWELMRAVWWKKTTEEPDREERRMAECLVHRRVPWEAFEHVVTRTPACARQAGEILDRVAASIPVSVRPGWYF